MIALGLLVILATALICGVNYMNAQDVLAKIAALKTSVDQLVALPSNPAPKDLLPLGDAVHAIKAEVDTKLAAPAA